MGKTYAVSDLHGNLDLYNKIINYLNKDDILYFLGDATDRGPDGWKILKDVYNNPKVKYIAGNHDIMLANRITRPNSYNETSIHYHNGGAPTWNDAKNDPEAKEIAKFIYNCPKYAIYINKDGLKIFMSHSGSTNIFNDEDLLWDRTEYIEDKNYTDYDIIVHGHTPIPYLIEDLEEVHYFYFGDTGFKLPEWSGNEAYLYHGYRYDIDALTIINNKAILFDLDTFKSICLI